MYHEIIKHTRKIKDKLEDSKNNENEGAKSSFQEKAKEIITEILIIIFAVSLSTLLHDWSENRTHQNEVKEFLVDIKDDLTKDIKGLKLQQNALSTTIKNYSFIRNLNTNRVDSLLKVTPDFQLNTNVRLFFGEENNGNYEGFESSGKTGYMEDKKLKKLILSYYKQHIPAAEKTGSAFNDNLEKIEQFITKNIKVEKKSTNILMDSSFQTDLEVGIKSAKENIKVGNEGIVLAEKIIAEINQILQK